MFLRHRTEMEETGFLAPIKGDVNNCYLLRYTVKEEYAARARSKAESQLQVANSCRMRRTEEKLRKRQGLFPKQCRKALRELYPRGVFIHDHDLPPLPLSYSARSSSNGEGKPSPCFSLVLGGFNQTTPHAIVIHPLLPLLVPSPWP
jgi:hypothetical protein